MFFSKTFGYALRAVLYIMLVQRKDRNIGLAEIAMQVGVPGPFLAKVLKMLVDKGFITSAKGPHGGFHLHADTLQKPLLELYLVTDGEAGIKKCVLHFRECDADRPCALHNRLQPVMQMMRQTLRETRFADLLLKDKERMMEAIANNAFKDYPITALPDG